MMPSIRPPRKGADSSPSRAAIYARNSTPKQASIPQQILACRQLADSKSIPVRYILSEQLSAKTTDRPKLQQVLQLAADGKIDTIIVWKLDRFVRSLRDLLNAHKHLEEMGVRLLSVTEQFDTSSSFGRFSFRNIASAAELERELIGERARMGKMAQAMAGRWPTERPPLGYTLGPARRLAIHSEEAVIVKQIFAEYADGIPLTEISRRLAANGTVTRRGVSFSPQALHKVVRNSLYVGQWSVLGFEETRPDLVLVDQKTWKKGEDRKGKRFRDGNAQTRRQAAIDAVFQDYFMSLDESTAEAT